MYSTFPQIIIGFHGCDKKTADNVINQKTSLYGSENNYDWLGHGIYFWENNYQRALEFAKEIKGTGRTVKNPIHEPAVIGAVINLGHCFNLLETESLQIVQAAYELFIRSQEKAGYPIPVNKPLSNGKDLLLRNLDCAVIESIHAYNKEKGENTYDTVRGVFFEGEDLYPNAGFKEKNHIQICVRNPNCIKGFFYPRKIDNSFTNP